jgi:excisionase family DNA binding protein
MTSTPPVAADPNAFVRHLLAAAQRQDEQAVLGLVNTFMRTVASAVAAAAPALLPEPEAARRLGISPRTLWSLANNGHIAVVRIGTSKRYDPRELDRYIAANTVKHALPVAPVGP